MIEAEFNLLAEKWLRVIDENCAVRELSVLELFAEAHKFKDLCGELPTQDVAIMRFLLAILQTVFTRYDLDGSRQELRSPTDALRRWQQLWERRKFPMEPINAYLEEYRERFWLFHPERPFYQTEAAKTRGGTEYGAAKLNGELSESSNKIRLFPMLTQDAKTGLTYAQAARWLIYVNAYDDTSAKVSKVSKVNKIKLPSSGAGWLGKIGLITAKGDNLFETLLLNMIMLNANEQLYAAPRPIWERDEFPTGERIEIPRPDNLPELYTLQSRRLLLRRSGQTVDGYYLLGGDFFAKENAFIEPMTLWRRDESKKQQEVYLPRRHNPAKQFWREFSAIIDNNDERKPGIVEWIKLLENNDLLAYDYKLVMRIASVQYGDKDFFVANVLADSLTIHSRLLAEINGEWRQIIFNAVAFCDEVAQKVWFMGREVRMSCGGNEDDAKVYAQNVQAEFYQQLNEPFARWLADIDPNSDDIDDKKKEWVKRVKKIALRLADNLVKLAAPTSVFGRIRQQEDSKSELYSSVKALNKFRRSIEILVYKQIGKEEE